MLDAGRAIAMICAGWLVISFVLALAMMVTCFENRRRKVDDHDSRNSMERLEQFCARDHGELRGVQPGAVSRHPGALGLEAAQADRDEKGGRRFEWHSGCVVVDHGQRGGDAGMDNESRYPTAHGSLDLTILYAAAYNVFLRDATNPYARLILKEIECVSVPQIWAISDHRVGATWHDIQLRTKGMWQRPAARKGGA